MGKLYDEEFIKLETENYNILNKTFNIRLKQEQNQKAIECLKEVKECFLSGVLMFDINSDLTEREQDKILEHYEEDKRILADVIDNKIKELEESDE